MVKPRELVIGLVGFGVLLILVGLANAARRYNTGPQWLRQFRIEKHTHF